MDIISIANKLGVGKKQPLGNYYPLAIGAYCKKYIRKVKLDKLAEQTFSNFDGKDRSLSDDWESYCTDFSTELPPDVKIGKVGHNEKCIEVNYGATGFMLIHRSVFETIIKKRPDLKYKNDIDFYSGAEDNFYDFFSVGVNKETKKYESEDYGFCKLYKECGGKIYCATDTNLVHIGRHKYQGNLHNQLKFWANNDR